MINYDQLLYNNLKHIEEKKKEELNKLLIKKGITTRKTDKITVNADYTHEYMYIFSERGYAYRITHRNKMLFDEMCKKIKYLAGNDNPILLKNPYDFSNFLFIKKIYPNAKFIFIHRNPVHVINSIMNLWKIHLSEKNEFLALYYKRYDKIYSNPLTRFMSRMYYDYKFPLGIFEIIHRSANDVKYYLKNVEYLPKEDYVSIRYEELCEKPNQVINGILNFLNLESSDIDFSGFIKPRKLSILPIVSSLKPYIFRRMKSYFQCFEYKI